MASWPFWFRRRHRGSQKGEKGKEVVAAENKPVTRKPSRRKSRRRRKSIDASTSRADPLPKGKSSAPAVTWPLAATSNGTDGPSRHDDGSSHATRPAASATKELRRSPHLRPLTREYADIPYNFQLPTASQTSIPSARERGKLQRPHSLRYQRNSGGAEVPSRRKSAKRKQEDQIREEEIRNMATPPTKPKRPVTYTPGLERHDSKKVKNDFSRRIGRPMSETSLPTENSLHSSMSSGSESHAFRISALAVFTPRPTIRYTISQQYVSGNNASRTDSGRSKRLHPSHEVIKESRFIDALADDLDAAALRELMDRDKRRRERKQASDIERAARKLRRKEEKQKAEQAERAREAEAAAAVGLGIEHQASTTETAKPDADRRSEAERSMILEETEARLTGADLQREGRVRSPSPSPSPVAAAVGYAESGSRPSERTAESPLEEPIVGTAQAVRYSQASISPPASPIGFQPLTSTSISHVMDQHSKAPSTIASQSEQGTDIEQRASPRSKPTRRISVLASIFRRGSKRFSSTRQQRQQQKPLHRSEESFSNASRESMARQPLPAHLISSELPRQGSSGAGGRKLSRFHEDLPETANVQPLSRVQSPVEGSDFGPVGAATARDTRSAERHRNQNSPPSLTEETSPQNVQTESRASPTSPNGRGSALAHQSLASVDSEGSWLSGKAVVKRGSRLRLSPGSGEFAKHQQQHERSATTSYEEISGMADDEYFRRLSPTPDGQRRLSTGSADMYAQRASSTVVTDERDQRRGDYYDAMEDFDDSYDRGSSMIADELRYPTPPLADEDVEIEIARGDIARRPRLMYNDARIKSSEGILNIFDPPSPPQAGAGAEARYPLSPPSTSDIAMEEAAETRETEGHGSPAADAGKSPVSSTPSDDREVDDEPVIVFHRARSVDLGKGHVRHLSAGSAKLLDIPAKRQSVDSKGGSSAASSRAAL